jgi:hypothetical protein
MNKAKIPSAIMWFILIIRYTFGYTFRMGSMPSGIALFKSGNAGFLGFMLSYNGENYMMFRAQITVAELNSMSSKIMLMGVE